MDLKVSRDCKYMYVCSYTNIHTFTVNFKLCLHWLAVTHVQTNATIYFNVWETAQSITYSNEKSNALSPRKQKKKIQIIFLCIHTHTYIQLSNLNFAIFKFNWKPNKTHIKTTTKTYFFWRVNISVLSLSIT